MSCTHWCRADCNRSELVCGCLQTDNHLATKWKQQPSTSISRSDFDCVVTELRRACRFQRGWWTLCAPQRLRRLNYSFHVCVELAQTDRLCVNILLLMHFGCIETHVCAARWYVLGYNASHCFPCCAFCCTFVCWQSLLFGSWQEMWTGVAPVLCNTVVQKKGVCGSGGKVTYSENSWFTLMLKPLSPCEGFWNTRKVGINSK